MNIYYWDLINELFENPKYLLNFFSNGPWSIGWRGFHTASIIGFLLIPVIYFGYKAMVEDAGGIKGLLKQPAAYGGTAMLFLVTYLPAMQFLSGWLQIVVIK